MTSWASTSGWASETAASLPPPPSTSNLSTSQSSSSSSLTHSLNHANTTTTTTSSLIDLEDTNVSNYHLLKKIGRGAFATCYLGKRNDGIYCAIKKFHTPLDELDVTLEASVHSEVESLKLLSLGTDYVTKYYGFFLDRCNSSHGGGARGATAPSFSLVVEYCNGGTLSELIDDHHNQNIYITEDRIMEIVVQCLEALRYVSCVFLNLYFCCLYHEIIDIYILLDMSILHIYSPCSWILYSFYHEIFHILLTILHIYSPCSWILYSLYTH